MRCPSFRYRAQQLRTPSGLSFEGYRLLKKSKTILHLHGKYRFISPNRRLYKPVSPRKKYITSGLHETAAHHGTAVIFGGRSTITGEGWKETSCDRGPPQMWRPSTTPKNGQSHIKTAAP